VPLTPGTRLGPYEILSAIGAGGMGEVYKARDTRLDRTVAIKILPEAFAADADRVARFQREAKTLAALNHPNIAQIFGLEQAGDLHALAMEFVAGEDLSERIARGPIPIDEALPIAKQIADALEAAHEQGIIHRDLKPANIKVREDGTVKVLDFGLAKAMDPPTSSPNVSQSPTITTPAMTHAGMILGTAAYMSPEQAKGRIVDRRADVWAFACVVYEMLAGRRAFNGEDIPETLASVLTREPDWGALPSGTPVYIRRLLGRCLQKDLRKRLPHLGIARLEIDEAPVELDENGRRDQTVQAPTAAPPRSKWMRTLPIVATAILATATTTAVMWRTRASSAPPVVARFSFQLLEGQRFSSLSRGGIAMSPDATQLVYVANDGLFVRRMADPELKPIGVVGAWGNLSDPVFSPDGRSLVFYATSDNTLKRIAVNGGAAVTIAPLGGGPPNGISWSDSSIVFGRGPLGVFRVPAGGGTPERIVSVEEGEQADGPQLLPGGDHVLFTLATGISADRWDQARIVVQSLKTGERKMILKGGSAAHYLPTGHLVYAAGGVLLAAPFDVDRLMVTGNAVPVVEGVSRSGAGATGTAQFSYSSTGSLIYVPGPLASSSTQLRLASFDRVGGVQPFNLPAGSYEYPRVSPDGTRAAIGTVDSKDAAIWIYDLSGANSIRRLTFGGHNRFPVWSADGRHVAFQSDRDGDLGVFWQLADESSATAERLTKPQQGESHIPEAWSPKDDRLLFSVLKGNDVTLSVLALQEKKITPFSDVRSQIPTAATISPDGRWVAYQAGVSGDNAVYVQSFPGGSAKYLISRGNAHHPQWSREGRELYYVPARAQPVIVKITTEPTFKVSDPMLFAGRKWSEAGPLTERAYDLMPDSEHILGLVDPSLQQENPQIQVVLNWFEELKARVPTK
jgi:eukaryotic-like serine/threonine-protein kinase